MNPLFLAFAGALACASLLPAQNPMIAENKFNYGAIKKNILASAEKMPDDGYGFAPVKEERTWAALMGHIADAQTRICGAATGEPKPATAGKLTGKAELISALKASFDICDAAWEGTTDANAHTVQKFFGGHDVSRLGILIYNTTHDNESYGTMAVYLRLKGVVPPSSEPKK